MKLIDDIKAKARKTATIVAATLATIGATNAQAQETKQKDNNGNQDKTETVIQKHQSPVRGEHHFPEYYGYAKYTDTNNQALDWFDCDINQFINEAKKLGLAEETTNRMEKIAKDGWFIEGKTNIGLLGGYFKILGDINTEQAVELIKPFVKSQKTHKEEKSSTISNTIHTHFGDITYNLDAQNVSFDGNISTGEMGNLQPAITYDKQGNYYCGDKTFADYAQAQNYAKIVERNVQQTFVLGLISQDVSARNLENTAEGKHVADLYSQASQKYGISITKDDKGNMAVNFAEDSKFAPPAKNEKGIASKIPTMIKNNGR